MLVGGVVVLVGGVVVLVGGVVVLVGGVVVLVGGAVVLVGGAVVLVGGAVVPILIPKILSPSNTSTAAMGRYITSTSMPKSLDAIARAPS